jgi:drug/metabolite transporter (DMT)-like permease
MILRWPSASAAQDRSMPPAIPAEQPPARPVLGALIVAASALLFSSKAVVVKCAYPTGVDALTLLALRMGMALPFFLVVLWREERRAEARLPVPDLARCLGLGVLGYYLASLLDFHGLRFIGVGLERMILYLYPTIVVLGGALLLRQRLGGGTILALAATYAGIGLTYAGEHHAGADAPVGAALVAGSALAYALFILGSGPLVERLGSLRFMAIAMSGACGAVLLHHAVATAASPGPGLTGLSVSVYGYGAVLALAGTVAPALLMGEGLRRVGSQRFVIISAIGPVGTVALGWLVLGETVSALNAAGIIVTLLAGVGLGLAPARGPR